MKIQIHKATIDVEFTNADELRRALERIADNYEAGLRESKGSYVKYTVHPKNEDIDTEAGFTLDDVRGKGFMFEDKDGSTYVLIESKLNNINTKL